MTAGASRFGLRQWVDQRPVLAAVCCAGIQFLVTVLILKAGSTFVPPEAFGKVKLAAFASTVLVPVLLVQWLGFWGRAGLTLRGTRSVTVFVASLLTCVLFLSMGVRPSPQGGIGGDVAMQLANAFGEELLFRGVIFAILLRLPVWQAIALSGVLFGSMHLIHGFMGGDWHAPLVQAAVTSMAGMMFAAVRYATGSLWLTIAVHMLLNLSIMYSNIVPAAGPGAMMLVERLANVFELALAGYVVVRERRAAMATV